MIENNTCKPCHQPYRLRLSTLFHALYNGMQLPPIEESQTEANNNSSYSTEAMADGMVKAAVDKLEELAFQELKLQSQVGKKVRELKDDLEWLRALLRHADQLRRQEDNEYLELWVRQTREVAFDAEDLLEEYVYKGQMHRHGFHDLSSFVRWLRQSAAGLFVRRSICTNIDGIKERLEEIKKKRDEHELKRLPTTWAHMQKHYSDW